MPLTEQEITEIQDLAWAMADEMISPEEVKRLEALLLADPDARKLYVECMQLQADLYLFFNPKPLLPPNIPIGPTGGTAPAPPLPHAGSPGNTNTPTSK